MVAPWKFDVLKTSIFALEEEARSFASQANICFKGIKFPRERLSADSSRQKHSILEIVYRSLQDYPNMVAREAQL